MTTVEKIHAEFDSAQDNLLKQAQELLSKSNSAYVISKSERLKSLGFTSSKTVSNSAHLVKTEEQASLIAYYKRQYPLLKFLTESELDRICSKYGLIYAPVGNFTGDVPEKNLKEIENAVGLRDQDKVEYGGWVKYTREFFAQKKLFNQFIQKYGKSKFSIDELKAIHDKVGGYSLRYFIENFPYIDNRCFSKCKITTIDKTGLFIAAPKKDFNLKGLKKKGFGFLSIFEKEVEDPVVFRYVRGGIQVLSKWGDEASDEILLNEINN